LVGKPDGKDYLEDIGADVRIILKRMLGEQG
jgi:hypothetical protein